MAPIVLFEVLLVKRHLFFGCQCFCWCGAGALFVFAGWGGWFRARTNRRWLLRIQRLVHWLADVCGRTYLTTVGLRARLVRSSASTCAAVFRAERKPAARPLTKAVEDEVPLTKKDNP